MKKGDHEKMLPINNNNLMEIGKIKIGGKGETRKAQSGKDYRLPIKLDHFIVTTNEKDKAGNYILDQEIMKVLGPSPKEIEVMLLFPTMEENWQTYRAYYSGSGKCVCRSEDAETASRSSTEEIGGKKIVTNKRFDIPCLNMECEFAKKNKDGVVFCKSHGKLSVVLKQKKTIGGVYTLRTTSWNSISNITNQLRFFTLCTRNMLAGLNFVLKVSPKTTSYNDSKGISHATKIYEVGIFYKGGIVDMYKSVEDYSSKFLSGEMKMIKFEQERKKLSYEDDIEAVEEFNSDVIAKGVNEKNEARNENETAFLPANATAKGSPMKALTNKTAELEDYAAHESAHDSTGESKKTDPSLFDL